jgi:hypothetical protein
MAVGGTALAYTGSQVGRLVLVGVLVTVAGLLLLRLGRRRGADH